MKHLSQTIAIEKPTKDKAAQALTEARNKLQRANLLSGIARTYTPKDDEGEKLPSESTRVQVTVPAILKQLQGDLTALFDVVATKDWTNCVAKADVEIDGKPILKDVPATYLLFLEKHLSELLNFAKAIPTLDASEEWTFDNAQNCYATPPTETVRTKKEMKVLVLAPATKEHPQQSQPYAEDVPVGRWKTIKYSGALPAKEHQEMIERIEALQKAVKLSREEANRTPAQPQQIGETLLRYIFR